MNYYLFIVLCDDSILDVSIISCRLICYYKALRDDSIICYYICLSFTYLAATSSYFTQVACMLPTNVTLVMDSLNYKEMVSQKSRVKFHLSMSDRLPRERDWQVIEGMENRRRSKISDLWFYPSMTSLWNSISTKMPSIINSDMLMWATRRHHVLLHVNMTQPLASACLHRRCTLVTI